MYLKYPYVCEITNREEAVQFILNKCSNCERFEYCSGLDAGRCNDIVEEVIKEYGIVRIKIEVPDDLTSLAGSSLKLSI